MALMIQRPLLGTTTLLAIALLLALPALARTPAAATSPASERAPATVPRGIALPGLSAAALEAQHWIARWPRAEQVALDAAAVGAHNARLFDGDASVTRLDALPEAMTPGAIRERILRRSSLPTAPRYGVDGRPIDETDRQRWVASLGLDALEPGDATPRPLGWALVTQRASLRTFPTTERVFSAPGDTDLEPMLQAVAGAWPQGRPLEGLRFEPGQLTLSVGGWPDEDISELSRQLEPEGWRIERAGPQLTLRRAPGGRS